MKQRINIARALLHQPEVLFLDEPTLGLDPQTTRSIREFIQELSQEGITIVLTTHIMVEAEILCHRVGIIDLGKIAALDTPSDLKRTISNEETTILDIDVPDLDSGLVSKLKSLDCVTSLIQKDSYEIRIHAHGEEAMDKIIDLVREEGKRIHSISSIEPTLEDVFLHLTGREIRDEAKEKIPSQRGRHWRRARARER
jgi:ABC-2 type transport system ATP-binding protein